MSDDPGEVEQEVMGRIGEALQQLQHEGLLIPGAQGGLVTGWLMYLQVVGPDGEDWVNVWMSPRSSMTDIGGRAEGINRWLARRWELFWRAAEEAGEDDPPP